MEDDDACRTTVSEQQQNMYNNYLEESSKDIITIFLLPVLIYICNILNKKLIEKEHTISSVK